MQGRRHTSLGLLGCEPLHQVLGLAQKRLVGRRVRAVLLDKVIEQLRHLLVEPRIGELLADDRLANVVDDPLGDGVPREFALLVQLAGDGVVDAGLDDQLRERQLAQRSEVGCGVGLDVGVEEVAHVRLVGLDV